MAAGTHAEAGAHAPSPLAGPRRWFIVLNVLGGLAVLGSYAIGILGNPETRGDAWGNVPAAWVPVYTVNMFLAAGGYFLFSHYVLFSLGQETRVAGRFPWSVFIPLYALILVPSALWMPLTFEMLETPGPLLWAAVRGVLFLVGLGSVGVLAAILATPTAQPAARIRAVLGCIPFCFQTAVLDAVVWPAFFPV